MKVPAVLVSSAGIYSTDNKEKIFFTAFCCLKIGNSDQRSEISNVQSSENDGRWAATMTCPCLLFLHKNREEDNTACIILWVPNVKWKNSFDWENSLTGVSICDRKKTWWMAMLHLFSLSTKQYVSEIKQISFFYS